LEFSEQQFFGPWPEGNPDIDEITKNGSVSGAIVMHASKEIRAVDNLAVNLQGEFIFKRSYKPMEGKIKLCEGQGTTNESVVWLQFGTNITRIGHN
jgi:hypothetical protein